MSVAGAIVGGIVDSGGIVDGGIAGNDGEPYTPVERITNGGFTSGASWTITGAAWTIGGGVATATGAAGEITQTLATGSVLPSGGTVAISVAITLGSEGVLQIQALRNGSIVQYFYNAAPAAGTLNVSVTADAEWDSIAFGVGALDFSLGTLDNISVIA